MSSEPRRPEDTTAADLVPPQSPDDAPQQPTPYETPSDQDVSSGTPASTESASTEPESATHDTQLDPHDKQPLDQPDVQHEGAAEDAPRPQSAFESPETSRLETAQPDMPQPEPALAAPEAAEEGSSAGGGESEQVIAPELAGEQQGPEDVEESEDVEETVYDEEVAPLELNEELDEEQEKSWYILKVQVNREESIRDALQRRVKIEGLDDYFGEVIVPTEDVAEFSKSGKRRIVKKKLYPGYIMVNMVINDDTWFLVRETPGIGDFTGSAGKPTPMDTKEVERILSLEKPDEEGAQPRPAIPFKLDDRVRVKDGNFQNFEGEVSSIDEANGRVTVMINIFNRTTPVEFEHWQIEKV